MRVSRRERADVRDAVDAGELDRDSSDALEWHPDNPFRPAGWRGRLAACGTGRRGTDLWVLRARRCLRCLARGGGHDDPRLAGVDPPVLAAIRLARGPDAEGRLAVEARLLAGQDDATIAARTGLGAAGVAAYAALWFDVRPLLGHADALLFAGIGPRFHEADGGREEALKAAAAVGGPAVVDALLGTGDGPAAGAGTGGDLGVHADFERLLAARSLDAEGLGLARLARLEAFVARLDAAEAAGLVVPTPAPGSVPVADLAALRSAVAAGRRGRTMPTESSSRATLAG